MKRVLPVSSDPPRAAPSPNAPNFQNLDFLHVHYVKSGNEDFGRERIDDDGLDDAVRRLCGLVTWRSDTDQRHRTRICLRRALSLRGRMVAVPEFEILSVVHAAHTAAWHGGGLLLLRSLRDHSLGRDHQAGDRRRVLQCDTTTFAGSTMPALSMSTYCSVWASKP